MKNPLVLIIGAIVIIGAGVFVATMDKAEKAPMADSMTEPVAMERQEETGVLVGGAMMLPSLDIVENASKASNVTTLVAAVSAAELVETLKGPGPFTVFGPNNAAFAKLPAGTIDTLLKQENKADLQSILTYHVVPGAYTSDKLTNGLKLKTVNGAELTFAVANGVITINGVAMIETPNVISSNGVTHVINTVLLPPAN